MLVTPRYQTPFLAGRQAEKRRGSRDQEFNCELKKDGEGEKWVRNYNQLHRLSGVGGGVLHNPPYSPL